MYYFRKNVLLRLIVLLPIMKKSKLILLTVILFCCSCQQKVNKIGKKFEKALYLQEQKAEQLTESLATQLEADNFDSIWNITQTEEQILFYVYSANDLVYWSQNWLAGEDVQLSGYGLWYYVKFQNAHTLCRWTRFAQYDILTVIPIKYAYPIENKQLRNTFISPFKISDSWDITRNRSAESYAVTEKDGRYLFSIVKAENEKNEKKQVDKQSRLADSFSYQSVQDSDGKVSGSRLFSIRLYYIIEVLLFVVLLILGIGGLIHSGGLKNMRMATKILYIIVSLILFVSIYVFIVSTVYVRQRYERDQKEGLRKKTMYIQKSLQDMYFWNMQFTEDNRTNMNIDLRDLSFTYQTDIHVYDIDGKMVGTSAPALFETGLISDIIAPEPVFSKQHTITQYESIGDMSYLASYTDFYNGNYVQIGYIAVSLYIATDEVNAEVDAFLAKLLPPNIIVLILAVVLSILLSRGLTRPLNTLSQSMRTFRIGEKGNRLNYEHKDEIGELVNQYNLMVEQLEQSSQLIARSEREGAWRTMARQIAHEINNPLTPMKLTIQQLQRRKKMPQQGFDEYFERATDMLIEQIDNLSRIAQSFSQFAKMPEVAVQKTDVAQKLFSVIQLFRENQKHTPIRYIGSDHGVMALTDPEQIGQVFNNLLKNALQAIEQKDDGDIIVMLKNNDDEVEITVSDNGPGIAEDIREKIFLPNFTTKSTGMGLGLAISKNIIDSSGGKISFETSEKGTTFKIVLATA